MLNQTNKGKSIAEQYLQQGKTQTRPASRAKRALATFLDNIILFFLLNFVLGFILKNRTETMFISIAINLLAPFIYAGYFYSVHAATPGKMAFNLEVVSDSETKLTFVQAALRDGIGKMVSSLILCIGFLMAFFREDRKALHDLMFKTKVIQRD